MKIHRYTHIYTLLRPNKYRRVDDGVDPFARVDKNRKPYSVPSVRPACRKFIYFVTPPAVAIASRKGAGVGGERNKNLCEFYAQLFWVPASHPVAY